MAGSATTGKTVCVSTPNWSSVKCALTGTERGLECCYSGLLGRNPLGFICREYVLDNQARGDYPSFVAASLRLAGSPFVMGCERTVSLKRAAYYFGSKGMAKISDFDACSCGDYRRDHVDGVGRCLLSNTISHDFTPCTKFRLFQRATEIPTFFREHPEYLER